jgi:hypothetical protein
MNLPSFLFLWPSITFGSTSDLNHDGKKRDDQTGHPFFNAQSSEFERFY